MDRLRRIGETRQGIKLLFSRPVRFGTETSLRFRQMLSRLLSRRRIHVARGTNPAAAVSETSLRLNRCRYNSVIVRVANFASARRAADLTAQQHLA